MRMNPISFDNKLFSLALASLALTFLVLEVWPSLALIFAFLAAATLASGPFEVIGKARRNRRPKFCGRFALFYPRKIGSPKFASAPTVKTPEISVPLQLKSKRTIDVLPVEK